MVQAFFVHWKTSLLGIAAGFFTVWGQQGWKSAAAGAAIALIGIFASDGGKVVTK